MQRTILLIGGIESLSRFIYSSVLRSLKPGGTKKYGRINDQT